MRLTLIVLAIIWLLRSNETVYLMWPDADFMFTMIGIIIIIPILVINVKQSAKVFFFRSGNIFLNSIRLLLITILFSAIISQNPTRTLLYTGLAIIFIAFWFTTLEVRWRNIAQLEEDLISIYFILVLLVFLSYLTIALELPTAKLGTRAMGISSNPNFLGLLALLTLSLTPAMFRVISSRNAKLIVAASSLLAFDVLLESQSRGSMLALIISYSTYFVIRLGLRQFIIPGIITLAVTIILNHHFLDGIISIFQRQDSDDEISAGRFEIYGKVLELISNSWLWLYGAGFRSAEDMLEGISVHNIYLQVILELGIVGLIAFTLLAISILSNCFRGRKVSVYILPVLSIFAYDLSESSLFGFGNFLTQISWLLIGFAVAANKLEKTQNTVFFVSRYKQATKKIDSR
jgi:O-antigen ligase